jgi:uncharacterized protein YbcI
MAANMASRIREASVKVANFLKLELGIAAVAGDSDLRENILTIQIDGGLNRIEQIVAQDPSGHDVLRRVYDIAHADYAEHVSNIVSRVLGIPVVDSRTRVDTRYCSISLIFLLAHAAAECSG